MEGLFKRQSPTQAGTVEPIQAKPTTLQPIIPAQSNGQAKQNGQTLQPGESLDF